MPTPNNAYTRQLPTRVKRVLDEINYTLEQGGVDAKKLWNILSALRGPDNSTSCLKDSTTNIIRGAVLSAQATELAGVSRTEPDRDTNADANRRVNTMFSHFINHAQDAFQSLNLKWNISNAPVKPAYVPPSNLKPVSTIWEA